VVEGWSMWRILTEEVVIVASAGPSNASGSASLVEFSFLFEARAFLGAFYFFVSIGRGRVVGVI